MTLGCLSNALVYESKPEGSLSEQILIHQRNNCSWLIHVQHR